MLHKTLIFIGLTVWGSVAEMPAGRGHVDSEMFKYILKLLKKDERYAWAKIELKILK